MTDHVRVTTVLGYHSGLNKIQAHILQNASERGERIHRACDAIIEEIGSGFVPIDEEGYIESFNKWKGDRKFIPKIPRLYCDTYMITGEIDQIYKEEDGLVLVDFKTSAKESKTWSLQGSAYSYLCSKKGINISRIEFIQLFKDGSDAKTFIYKEYFEMFLKCLDTYKYFEPREYDYYNYLEYI